MKDSPWRKKNSWPWPKKSAAASALKGTATIRLAGAAEVRALNRKYRGMDHATDVLSFPLGEKLPDGLYAGDVLICCADRRKAGPAELASRWKKSCCC